MKSIKTISVFALAAFAFAGCQTELELTPASPFKFGEEITITASQEMGTKTCLGQEGAVLWGIGDQISVFYGDGDNGGNQFISQNEAPAATAEFKGTLTTVTGVAEGGEAGSKKFWGVSPYNADIAVTKGVVTTSVPQIQDALENSFDPAGFPTVACSDNLNLAFRNAFGLLEITLEVEGVHSVVLNGHNDEVLWGPCSIALDNGIPVVTMTGDPASVNPYYLKVGIKSIGDDPLSTSCKYYLALPPVNFTKGVNITLYNKSSEVITSISTDKEVKIERNKIHAVTLTEPEPQLVLKKVWGHYGVAGVAGWPAYVEGVEDLDGFMRNATMDDDFVYIPKTAAVKDGSGENFTEAKIFMLKVSDGSYQGLVTPATDPAYMAGTWASTFPVSCARVMKNTNANLNNGKDILVCTNLSDGQNVRLYAWENGVDHQPRLLTNFYNGRRWGDRISVEGTYQDGRVWYRSYSAGITAYINLAPNYTAGFNGSHAWNWVEGIGATATDDGDAMTEFTSFNKGAYAILSSNSGKGTYLLTGTTTTETYPDYKRAFGWSPFTFNEKDYLAYIDLSGGTNLPIVTILEGASNTVDALKATLDAKKVVVRASIVGADQNDFTTTGVYATNNQADCAVRIIDGVPYILGATRGSIALFKLVLE